MEILMGIQIDTKDHYKWKTGNMLIGISTSKSVLQHKYFIFHDAVQLQYAYVPGGGYTVTGGGGAPGATGGA
jgi:hypothetical protein